MHTYKKKTCNVNFTDDGKGVQATHFQGVLLQKQNLKM